ncbi:MAG TPA: hypothetical protein VHO70_08610, partial [Chitinispirillaceae bacterium]|nr:hypothetical protein [Chitinispirillaceae bacterium]
VFASKPQNRYRDHERTLFISEGYHNRTLEQNLTRFSELVASATNAIYSAKEKDDVRGKSIIPDYEMVHTPAHEDSFVIETMKNNKLLRDDIGQLLAILKK